MSWSDKAQVYKQRKPRESPLWQLLSEHFDDFEERYDELFSKQYGFYRPIISHVVRKFQECGDRHEGFARVRCPDCHHKFLLAFSCRERWFCPSCHAKKAVQFAAHLQDNVLYPVPHRQYVFSIPKIIRRYFLYERKVIKKILDNLGLYEDKPMRNRAPLSPPMVEIIIEPYDDDWPD